MYVNTKDIFYGFIISDNFTMKLLILLKLVIVIPLDRISTKV